MFARLLWRLLRGNRGRLAVALVSVASGAAVISALLNLDFDIERKLTQEFRSLGANVTISRAGAARSGDPNALTPGLSGSPVLMDQDVVLHQMEQARTPDVAAAAPYLYIVARAQEKPVVVAGTWLDQVPKLEPTWKIEGYWVTARDSKAQCLVGRNAARQFHVEPGGPLELNYLGRRERLSVAGVIDAGSAEDNQVFVSLPVAQELAELPGQIEVVQVSVSGTTSGVSQYASRLASSLPGYEVRPLRQVTEAEGNLLNRTRFLIVSMVLLILVLTALCVLATMAALAMERRADVGLMKALGGSMSRILQLFLAEVSVLAAVGGLIGCVAGMALAHWLGQRVFGTPIQPRWEIFPLTIALMTGVALAGALPLRLLGSVRPAVILRGE